MVDSYRPCQLLAVHSTATLALVASRGLDSPTRSHYILDISLRYARATFSFSRFLGFCFRCTLSTVCGLLSAFPIACLVTRLALDSTFLQSFDCPLLQLTNAITTATTTTH